MIGLIGSLCDDRESASGQAVRTTILYNVLCKKYGKQNIYNVNTHGFRLNPIKVIYKTLMCIIKCEHIIVMVHENGRKVFFPILYYAKIILGRKIYHNVIGGSFREYLNKNSNLIKYSKNFNIHWVQMSSQIIKLKEIGLHNVELLPNTKENKILALKEIHNYEDIVFRFCMCSRISIAKGTEIAIRAIENINKKKGYKIVTLDIFGKPDDDYIERFNNVIENSSEAIRYCGFIPNDRTVYKLKEYYMLLFPSTYEGEGFPGTFWDAFAAGLPIITTDWHYNSEIVSDNLTGLVYDYRDESMLEKKIEYAINNINNINRMKVACIVEAQKYAPEKVFPIIFKYLSK